MANMNPTRIRPNSAILTTCGNPLPWYRISVSASCQLSRLLLEKGALVRQVLSEVIPQPEDKRARPGVAQAAGPSPNWTSGSPLESLFLSAGLLLGSGCSSSFVGTPSIRGSYDLARYDGKALPSRIFQLPTRDGQPTDCWYTATDGRLTIDAQGFRLVVTFKDSCTEAVMWIHDEVGTYQWDGGNLTLIVKGADIEFRNKGTVDGELVTVDEPPHSLTFRRHAP